MSILVWIVVGAIAGSLARTIMPGPAAGGMYVAALIGILGAFVGGSIGTVFPADQPTQYSFALLTATTGAMYFLFAYRCFAQRTPRYKNNWHA